MIKKARGRILAVLLAAMLILSCLPAGMAFANAAAPAAPAISPNGGSISTSGTVGIEANPAVSQSVYYTIASGGTGNMPAIDDVNTYVYTAPFIVSPTAGAYTVEAAVYDSSTGLWSSPVSSMFLVVSDATAAPTAPAINPNGGSISTSDTVGIEASPTVSQSVYYTTDESWPYLADGTPAVSASVYAAPFNLPAGTDTVNAAVYDSDAGLWSSVATAIFNVSAPGGGSSGGGGSVTTTPSVETNTATTITDSGAVLNGSISSDNGYDITDYGFVWGADSSSLTDKLAAGTDDYSGAFTATLDDLTAGTTYYFKAYATNENGTSYGAVMSFSTTGSSPATPTTPTTGTFSDVSPSYWAYGVINQLSGAGYVYGYPDGSFKPDNTITRAEFVTVMDKVLKPQGYNPATPDFNDVSPADWFYASVEDSVNAGIIKGDGDRIFSPGSPITREEMATILVNALGKQEDAAASMGGNTDFTDDAGISSWARGSIAVAVKSGLLKGYPDGSFQPQGNATRAEACAMISSFLSAQSGTGSSPQ